MPLDAENTGVRLRLRREKVWDLDPGTWAGMYIRLPGAGPAGVGLAGAAIDEVNAEVKTAEEIGGLEAGAETEDEERDADSAEELEVRGRLVDAV